LAAHDKNAERGFALMAGKQADKGFFKCLSVFGKEKLLPGNLWQAVQIPAAFHGASV
jgi:hypothetical protein